MKSSSYLECSLALEMFLERMFRVGACFQWQGLDLYTQMLRHALEIYIFYILAVGVSLEMTKLLPSESIYIIESQVSFKSTSYVLSLQRSSRRP
jgi:hypothetical protein